MRLAGLVGLLAAVCGGISQTTAVLEAYDGCAGQTCILGNANLRFGNGAESSVNAFGLFQQPFYYSYLTSAWYKLTYSVYPLDLAIGMGNTSTHWSKTTISDLYSQPPSVSNTNYSSFVLTSQTPMVSQGYGTIVARRTYTIQGRPLELQNTFSLGQNDSFVKVVTSITNRDNVTLNNVMLWVGTRDDFVGLTDVNVKTRGNLVGGQFQAVSSPTDSSYAIMITNPTEGVLFYSETSGVMTSYSICCSFMNVVNTYPLSLAPSTVTGTDGSYAAVLPLGDIAPGGTGSITWYYAAGAISSLSSVVNTVSQAQQIDSGVPQESLSATPTFSIWSTASAAATAQPSVTAAWTNSAAWSVTASGSIFATKTRSAMYSFSAGLTVLPTASASASASISQSSFVSFSGSGSASASAPVSGSGSASASASGSGSVSRTAIISLSVSPSASASTSAFNSQSESGSVSRTAPNSLSATATASTSATASASATATATATATGTNTGSATAHPMIPIQQVQLIQDSPLLILLSVGFSVTASLVCGACCIGLIVYMRNKKYAPCPYCEESFLASELKAHLKKCQAHLKQYMPMMGPGAAIAKNPLK